MISAIFPICLIVTGALWGWLFCHFYQNKIWSFRIVAYGIAAWLAICLISFIWGWQYALASFLIIPIFAGFFLLLVEPNRPRSKDA